MTLPEAELVDRAIRARDASWSPYSKYAVGAAILTTDGRIFCGCNVENASYGLTVCAERVAIWKAVSEGARGVAAVAVATRDGAALCGACRQVLREFSRDAVVFCVDDQRRVRRLDLPSLLPESFGPDNLLS